MNATANTQERVVCIKTLNSLWYLLRKLFCLIWLPWASTLFIGFIKIGQRFSWLNRLRSHQYGALSSLNCFTGRYIVERLPPCSIRLFSY